MAQQGDGLGLGQVFGQRLLGRAEADVFRGVGCQLVDLRTHIVEKAPQRAQLTGAGLGAVVRVAGVIQIVKDVSFGNLRNIGGGDAGQRDFIGRRGIGHALPALHHKAEKAAQVKIVSVDSARGAQLYKIQIVKIFNYIIGNVQIRRMTLRMGHINITAHEQTSKYKIRVRNHAEMLIPLFIVAQIGGRRQFHKLIRNANHHAYYSAYRKRKRVNIHTKQPRRRRQQKSERKGRRFSLFL